jgi:FAD synthetase
MTKVMATGVFDILHVGHIYFLEEAKKLGDELVVVVATDYIAEKVKHRAITPQDLRVKMVGALKVVDKVVIGKEKDIYQTVDEIRPDIIALGYDQLHDEDTLLSDLKKRGIENVKIVRISKFAGDMSATREIIKKVIAWYLLQRKLREVEGDGKL